MDESTVLRLLALIREGDQAREQLLEFVYSYLRLLAGQPSQTRCARMALR